MTKEQHNVKDFMIKAGQETPEKPCIPSLEVRILRAKLIMEEAMELINNGLAIAVEIKTSTCDDEGWINLNELETLDFHYCSYGQPNLVEIADGCADLGVVGPDGTALACGIDLQPIREEVDRSNMSKFIDGHRREDGKWVKGPSYSPANLQPIIDMQSK